MASQHDSFAIVPREEVFAIAKKFKEHLEKLGIAVKKMYLYGSYAKNNPQYGSDIDLCIISPNFHDRIEANFFLGREAIKIDSRIETVAYSPEKFEDWIPLVWEIQQTGIEVN